MPTAQLPVDTSLLFKLIRVVNLTARPFSESIGRQHRLSINEWRILVVLASHPGSAATVVVDSTGLDKMSVSRAVASLVAAGRVDRCDDPTDQRRSQLYLTPAGESLFAEIGEQAKQREAQLFGGASADELTRLNAALDRMTAALERAQSETE